MRGRRGLAPPAALEARQPALTGLGLGLELGPGSVRGPVPALLVTRVVLASCHLDQDPRNNRPRNLAALGQRCHILHDREEHRRTRWRKAFLPRALGDLFR